VIIACLELILSELALHHAVLPLVLNRVLTKGRFLDLNWPVKLLLTDRFA